MATMLRDPELRAIRALMFIERRVKSARSLTEIATEFNVSPQVVANEIDYAKRMGLLVKFEDDIIEGLVPLAVKAFKDALENGDSQVALEVLKGTGLLRKQSTAPLTAPAPVEDSLEIHIKRIQGTRHENLAALPSAPSPIVDPSRILEGTVVHPALAPKELGPSGDENLQPLPGGNLGRAEESPRLPFEPDPEA